MSVFLENEAETLGTTIIAWYTNFLELYGLIKIYLTRWESGGFKLSNEMQQTIEILNDTGKIHRFVKGKSFFCVVYFRILIEIAFLELSKAVEAKMS